MHLSRLVSLGRLGKTVAVSQRRLAALPEDADGATVAAAQAAVAEAEARLEERRAELRELWTTERAEKVAKEAKRSKPVDTSAADAAADAAAQLCGFLGR